VLVTLGIGAAAPARAQDAPKAPRALRVEMRTAPTAIDDAHPRFSWEVDDPRRGAVQSAYRILVSTIPQYLRDEKGDEWDSGKVAAGDTCQIEYRGKPLVPGRTYFWRVRTWDAADKPSSWSEPGSFVAAPAAPGDWRARWIRAGQPVDSGGIGFHSAWAQAEDAWPWVQLDFGSQLICERLVLHPARPEGDASKPGELFPLRVRVYTDASGQFADKAQRIADLTFQDLPNAGAEPLEIPFSRYTLRYLRIVATKLQKQEGKGFAMALGEVEVFDGQNNIAPRALVTTSDALKEPGWFPEALTDGASVGSSKSTSQGDSLPRLRGSFTIDGTVQRARIHAAALGAYELSINGKLVDTGRLAPGWTDYARRVAFESFEVGAFLKAGENVIGVQLAPGWYAGRIGMPDGGEEKKAGLYGAEPAFLAQLDVVLDSGKRVQFQTDETWRGNRTGPLISADLYDGEARDARRETGGWNVPLFQGADWRPVDVAKDLAPALFAQPAEPIRARAPRPAVKAWESAPSTFVYDFGQNLSGTVRLKVNGKVGDTLVLRHGELVDEKGRLLTENLRGAAQTDRFALRQGEQVLEAPFTIHGFRYVEVAGWPAALDLAAVEAIPVGSDVRDVGAFTCSDETLNALWNAASETVRSNLVGIPTNCTQRDERLGWAGDVQIVAPFVLDRFDAANLLGEWLVDVRGAQTKDGRFPDLAPHPFDPEKRFRGTPGWADAGVLVPWEIYQRTGDARLLSASAEAASAWVKFVAAKNPGLVWRAERGGDFGDRFNGSALRLDDGACEGCEIPKDLFATAFFARSARITARMFAARDHAGHAEADSLADRAAVEFRKAFAQGDKLTGDSQAGYALALDFELYETPAQAQAWADRLAARVREQKRLTCGIQTAHRALIALSEWGHHDLAVDLARRKTLPSWGYMLANGATTLWEKWDAHVPGRGFQDPESSSLDSIALAAVGQWLIESVAGIAVGDRRPELDGAANGSPGVTSAQSSRAWQRFRLEPRIGAGLTDARAHHDSIAGRIVSAWSLAGEQLTYECTVPPNTTADLLLPASADGLTVDGQPVSKAPGVEVASSANDGLRIVLQAGSYVFQGRTR
jgi:alpha-L-rhamnosidase